MTNLRFVRKILPPGKLSQIILGGQDGLVNTFGVILGIAAASSDIRIVIAGGLAASIAEAVSMGAVAYTSQRASHDHYLSLLASEKKAITERPKEEKAEVKKIYQEKGFSGEELSHIVQLITSNKKAWLSIMMSDELKVSPIENRQVYINSVIVFLSAFLGALIPLFPFFFFSLKGGIYISFFISSISLFGVGFYQAKSTVGKPIRNGLELLVIGMSAAVIGYGIGYLFR